MANPANITQLLGVSYMTSISPKTEKEVLEGLTFSKVQVPNIAGALAPLSITKKAFDRVNGKVAIYNATLSMRSDDHKTATFSLICEDIKEGLTAVLPAEVSPEAFVNYGIKALQSYKPQSARNPENAARGEYGRSVSFSAIVEGGEIFKSEVQNSLHSMRVHLSAMEKLADKPEELRTALLEFAEKFGVDTKSDRVKFREITD